MELSLTNDMPINPQNKSKTVNPNFKAKLLFEVKPDLITTSHRGMESATGMFALQEAIKNFMALPKDMVIKVTKSNTFQNLKNGLTYSPNEYTTPTGNDFFDRFIHIFKPKKAHSEIDMFLGLDTEHGKLKNCTDIFKKYEKNIISDDKSLLALTNTDIRPWNDISQNDRVKIVENLISEGKISVVKETKTQKITLCYDGPNPNKIYTESDPDAVLETIISYDIEQELSNNGKLKFTQYQSGNKGNRSYTGNDPRT